jgi:uncharacterized short protein YbdD (DUF466 family)
VRATLASRALRPAWGAMAAWLSRAWRTVRVATGDAAYESYLAHAGEAPLSREAFYLDTLRRRYSRPNRCC